MARMEGTVDTVAQAAHWQTAHHARTARKFFVCLLRAAAYQLTMDESAGTSSGIIAKPEGAPHEQSSDCHSGALRRLRVRRVARIPYSAERGSV